MSNFYDTRDIQRWSQGGKSAARLAGKSTYFAILADRPRHLERDGISGAEQALSTTLVIVMMIATGIAWQFTPALGAVLSLLGVYFVTRRVSAFASVPLRLRPFFRLVGETIPAWYTIAALSVIAASTLYRSVVLEWIPEWVRDGGYYAASLAMVINLTILPIVLGTRAVRQHRQALQDEARIEAALAHMLGGSPKALFEPNPATGLTSASWGFAGDNLLVDPPATVDLQSLEARLAETALGQDWMIQEATYERLLLVPASDEHRTRIRHRAQSGGLVEGTEDLTPGTPAAPAVALDEDDPFARFAVPEEPAADAAGDVPTFGEESWR